MNLPSLLPPLLRKRRHAAVELVSHSVNGSGRAQLACRVEPARFDAFVGAVCARVGSTPTNLVSGPGTISCAVRCAGRTVYLASGERAGEYRVYSVSPADDDAVRLVADKLARA